MIDPSLLPRRACVDTVVFVLGLGNSADPRAPGCREFLEGMEKRGGRILVTAPTIAEYLRDGQRQDLPRMAGIEPVAFDDVAAKLLASLFPASILKQVQADTNLAYAYIKYDALIVACAVRHRADHFVTLDRVQTGLARRAGLTVHAPSEYEQRQLTLPGADKPPSKPRK